MLDASAPAAATSATAPTAEAPTRPAEQNVCGVSRPQSPAVLNAATARVPSPAVAARSATGATRDFVHCAGAPRCGLLSRAGVTNAKEQAVCEDARASK